MKRKFTKYPVNGATIECMGALSPAEIKPAQATFHPSIQLDQLENLVYVALKTDNRALITGLTQAVINDVRADLNSGKVPVRDIMHYYLDYADAFSNSSYQDETLLQELFALLDTLYDKYRDEITQNTN